MTTNTGQAPIERSRLRPNAASAPIDGLYFRVISNAPQTDEIGHLADKIYQDILADVKLTESLRFYSLIPLYLYATREEYLKKTGMPYWSGAGFLGNAIVAYQHPQLPETLAHEITHLIFHEFFTQDRPDLLWLNEGLALKEESIVKKEDGLGAAQRALSILRNSYVPLQTLTLLQSALKHQKNEAQAFYVESRLLVDFLMEKGGRVGFYEMLKALKSGRGLDDALAMGFPGKWNSLSELEANFKADYSLK